MTSARQAVDSPAGSVGRARRTRLARLASPRRVAAGAATLAAALALGGAAAPPAAAAEDRLAPGPPHPTRLEIGSPPPAELVLPTLDGETLSTATADRPLLLLFFRGVW